MSHTFPDHPRVGVGVLVWKGDALLLIRRGKPPGMGEWSLPGGSQELGETLFETAAREVMEETCITARPVAVLTAVDNIVQDPDGRVRFHYTIVDVVAEWQAGEPVAATDVLEARWATPQEWRSLVVWQPLLEVLEMALAARQGCG
ncbi:NUDIX hydrolase [Indioceanicola profundi]|uniref:NUDIX hydrolase n=1 Tax=Indioceanicola profundi TaxID=2220096 RepID=UPI000E6ADFB8|nr:NUDIX hydrolase [Indioceanicola profundi]